MMFTTVITLEIISILFFTTALIKHADASLRIIGGEIVSSPNDEYPWFYRGDGCGASLVAPDILLTAAHCEISFDNSKYEKLFIHPSYTEYFDDHVENDFMVVKLKDPINNVALVTLDDGKFSSLYKNDKTLWAIGMYMRKGVIHVCVFVFEQDFIQITVNWSCKRVPFLSHYNNQHCFNSK